jgi:hypothetical protein
MLRRFELSCADAEVLLGMLRKILWKLHEPLLGGKREPR